MRTCSPSEERWLTQPPQRTAYFSSARQPGVVLRVSTIRVPVPSTAAANFRDSVATPERRWIKFSAVRSAVSSAAVGPVMRRTTPPVFTRSPSCAISVTLSAGSTRANTRAATSRPHTTRSCFASIKARDVCWAGKIALLVTSPRPASSSSARSIRWSVRGVIVMIFWAAVFVTYYVTNV